MDIERFNDISPGFSVFRDFGGAQNSPYSHSWLCSWGLDEEAGHVCTICETE